MADYDGLVELLEDELNIVVNKAHKCGLNYWQILKVFMKRCVELMAQSEVEYHIKGG